MIDFFKPVETAWARMENCLFKPFDLGKWFVLGFTAWLASFLDGVTSFSGGGNENYGSEKNKVAQEAFHGAFEKALGWGLPFWVGIGAIVFVIILCLILVFVWLGCRGQFMFLDNLIHGRAEVRKPWREFKTRANHLFVVYAGALTVASIITFGFFAGALIFFWQDFLTHKTQAFTVYLPWAGVFFLLILGWLLLVIFLFFLREFGVPLIYRHDCTGGEAVKRVWAMGCAKPLDFLVYFFLRLVMGVLFLMLACIAGCLTCCLGFLPYLSAVLTLPLRVFRTSYTLDCLTELTGESFWLVPEDSTPPILPPPLP